MKSKEIKLVLITAAIVMSSCTNGDDLPAKNDTVYTSTGYRYIQPHIYTQSEKDAYHNSENIERGGFGSHSTEEGHSVGS